MQLKQQTFEGIKIKTKGKLEEGLSREKNESVSQIKTFKNKDNNYFLGLNRILFHTQTAMQKMQLDILTFEM